MSNLHRNGNVIECLDAATGPTLEALPSRPRLLGNDVSVSRLLPCRSRRRIGPWCFLDAIGPVDASTPIDVPTHPHIGLQTVTWLYQGAMLHKDSLGSEQHIEAGQLNVMTAGHGICHCEESVPAAAEPVHGMQFWIALPAEQEDIAPAFEHLAELPRWQQDGVTVTLMMGELDGRHSPATVYSPLLGAELVAQESSMLMLPVPEGFELGVCVSEGVAECEGHHLEAGTLYYLGAGRSALSLSLAAGCRLMVLGGAPLCQPLLLWWNFIGRDHARIARALADWQAYPNRRFGAVDAYHGEPLAAPPLDPQVRLKGS